MDIDFVTLVSSKRLRMRACARGYREIWNKRGMKSHIAMQQFLTSSDYRHRWGARSQTCRESGSCGKSGTR